LTWNDKTDLNHALKYISWELNLPLNLVGIRHMKCSAHKYRNIMYYKFQNSCIKLLRQCEYAPVNILIHNTKLYVIKNLTILPKLINTPEKKQINFKNRILTPTHMLQIINKNLAITFPFSINIYTSYIYLRENSKNITSNMIGQYLPDVLDKENIVHIFITPNLRGNQLFMHQLNLSNNKIFHFSNIHSYRHLTEGQKITFPFIHESDKPGTNKECICEHKKVEKYFPPRKYKNLGKNFYFLFFPNIFLIFYIFSSYSFT